MTDSDANLKADRAPERVTPTPSAHHDAPDSLAGTRWDDATVVKPVQFVSREGLWRGVDIGVIDGAVNGVAAIVDAGSIVLRRLQTGSVRAYAGSLFIGVVLMLGYYLWR